jgi:AcrR family transcriptional regulator
MTALPRVALRPVPPARPKRVDEIVATAQALLADEGESALTMRRIGDALGIKAPSLYKHLPSREALVLHLVEDALYLVGDQCHAAVDRPGRRTPVQALLQTYRAYGVEHAALYRLTTGPDLPRAELTPGLEGWAGEPFYRAAGEPHRAQALWAFAHGMVMLEIDHRFLPGSDLDRTWRAGAAAFA